MTEFATLSEMLLARRDSDHRLHFVDSDDDHRSLTFTELVDAALACLQSFQERGLGAGDEIVIFTDNNQEFLTAFWAAILGGIVPVPVAVGISDEHRLKLFRILQQLERASIFSNDGLFTRLREFADSKDQGDILELLKTRSVVSSQIATTGQGTIHQARPQDRAFIQYSSGSTSAPKGVCLTHLNVCTNTRAIIKGLQLSEQDRSFSWMPLTHDMGLIGYHISMLTANMHHAIMDTSVFVRRPLLWLQKVTELGSTVLCSPNFGYKHYLRVFERKGAGEIDLSHVRLLLNGAEPISVSLCEEFLAAMKPHGLRREALLAVYGLAEATLAVTHPVLGDEYTYITLDRHQLRNGEPYVECADGSRDAVRFVRLGTLFDGCDLRITDNHDVEVPAGHIGHVQLSGPNITEGIYGDRNDEAGLFTTDGWLRTGDCGAIANGELIITGRDKEIVIVNGQNYSPHDIEEVVCELDEIELGKVVVGGASPAGSQGEELLVFILYRKDPETFRELAKAVRRVVGAQVGLEVDHVIPVARVPKTTSGKIQRSMLVQAYLDGEYDEFLARERALHDAATATAGDADPLVRELEAICAEFSKEQIIGPDDNLFEVGISSLTLTEIMLAIDEKYPGKADINDLFDYPTLR
ncbi:MAG: non-ribosomal peptide synthetase, partial [Gammaproteobacteria bacterium]|nr:non-ribosomal peptide synthetase [Gammaproteobacteria bacterium]